MRNRRRRNDSFRRRRNDSFRRPRRGARKHKSQRKKIFGLMSIVICFCVVSSIGTMAVGSDDYLDVRLSMMFYYNVLTAVIYQDEISELENIIDETGIKTKKESEDKRIEEEHLRIQKAAEIKRKELAEKQDLEREYELLIFTYTNNERVKHDLSPLQLSEKISNVARLHSQDMLENDFFEHDNLRGQTPTDRGNSQGVSCVKNYGSYYTEGLGENIYTMYGYNISNVLENSKNIVNGWMESQGHRENILDRNYDQIGVGVKFSNYEIYATQNFC